MRLRLSLSVLAAPLFLLLGLLPYNVSASHIAGMDMSYECIGPNVYRVHIYWYNFCSGALPLNPGIPPDAVALMNGQNITWDWCAALPSGACDPNCPAPINVSGWQWDASYFQDVTPVCNSQTTTCGNPGSSVDGIRSAHFYADFDFSNSTCYNWEFSVEANARNGGIATLNNSGGQSIHNVMALDRFILPCNSSPTFNSLPVPFLCLNQPFTFNQGATDIDGDSVSYEFGTCLGANGNPANYQFPYTFSNFISSANPIFIDPITGDITLLPNQIQKGVVCVYVKEWRDGVLIGTYIRDIQITVTDCPNTLPELSNPSGIVDTLGNFTGISEFNICEGDSVNFFITVQDDDGDSTSYSWNTTQTPGLVITLIDTGSGQPYLHITGPPLTPRPAPYIFTITVNDGACPLNGITQLTYRLNIGGGDLIIGDFVSASCDIASFNAPVFGVGPFNYEWSGAGGLDTNSNRFLGTLQHTYPSVGDFPYTIRVIDGYGCENVDSGIVTINSVGLDTTSYFSTYSPCQYDTFTVQYAGFDGSATFQWNFGIGAVPATATGPGPHTVFYLTPGPKVVVMNMENNGCEGVFPRNLIVYPKPLVTAGSDMAFCSNDVGVTLMAATNDTSSGCVFSWFPTIGLADPGNDTTYAYPGATTAYSVMVNCGGCSSDPDEVIVSRIQMPQIQFPTTQVNMCLGQVGVVLPGNAVGLNPPFAYEWIYDTTGISNAYTAQPPVNPSSSQYYYLQATDAYGCRDTDSIYVNVNLLPVADAGPDVIRCIGSDNPNLQGVALGGSGSFAYQWTPSIGLSASSIANPVVTTANQTTYLLQVTDLLTGCSSDAVANPQNTVTVNVGNKPTVSGGPDVSICWADSVTIGGFATNGSTSDYTFMWSPQAGLDDPTAMLPNASPSFTTIYYVRAMSGGCLSDADSVVVTLKPRPTLAAVTPTHEVCPGDSVAISVSTQALSSGLTFNWTPALGLSDPSVQSPMASPDTTTTYSVTAIENGCESQVAVQTTVIVRPVPTIDADTTTRHIGVVICGGNPVNLPAIAALPSTVDPNTPLYISWWPSAGLDDTTLISPVANPAQTTMYYMSARAGFGASVCTVMDSIMVYVEPNLTVTASTSEDTICAGETVTLTAEGGLGNPVIAWAPNTNLSSPTGAVVQAQPFETTTYMVELEEANCRVYDSVRVVVLPQTVASFSFLADTGCGAQTVSFFDNSTLAVTRIWDFGDGSTVVNEVNPTHTYDAPGTYTVTLQVNNAEGCSSLAPAQQNITINALGSADYTTTPDPTQVLVLPEASVQFTPQNNAVSHLWLFGDGTNSHEANPVHVYRLPGHYTVQYVATDATGCVYTNTEKVFVVRSQEVDIPNVFTPNGDGVNDLWQPNTFGFSRFTVKVIDRWGNEVYSANNVMEGWKGLLENGEEAPEGVYYYYLKLDDRELRGSFTLIR